MIKKLFTLILALIFTFSLCSCVSGGSSVDFYCFNTAIHIQSGDKPISKQTENKIKNIFYNLEEEFDLQNENSFTFKFNSLTENENISLTDNGLEIFKAIEKAYSLTTLFDISVYPLTKLWGFAPYTYNANYTPPPAEQVEQQITAVGYENIKVDLLNKNLTKLNQNIKIDLGGIVKGYAVDLAGKILKEEGHTKGYISVGGSSLHLLKVDSLDIRHPRNNSGKKFISIKAEENISLSTSGDYERFYLTTEGKKYCHIINPKTGYPTNTNIASATIMGLDGALSDALTTAICLMEYSTVQKENSELIVFLKTLLNAHPNISVFVVFDDGVNKLIFTNKKQGENFTLHDLEYSVANV